MAPQAKVKTTDAALPPLNLPLSEVTTADQGCTAPSHLRMNLKKNPVILSRPTVCVS